jgi:hypothetical protein
LVPASDTEESRRQLAAIRSFVAEYHRFAARRADSSGRFHYDLYPHHMWSNPMIFPAASEMDLRRVVGYELVVDALCVIKAETAMTMETLSRARTAFPISLRP